jgi:hypothetical protein
VVYGPQADQDKVQFLSELALFRSSVHRAEDKSNDRLDRRCMRRFRAFLNTAELEELHVLGRRFTWSSERDQPTLERLDRVFASVGWLDKHPNHVLRALSTDCSDHCPLLLSMNTMPWAKKRFRFEPYWLKLPGCLEVIAAAWSSTLLHADLFRILDYKLRNVARALRSWSDKKIGSVRLQLALAKEVILRLEVAQESRTLTSQESVLRKSLKMRVLGLAWPPYCARWPGSAPDSCFSPRVTRSLTSST